MKPSDRLVDIYEEHHKKMMETQTHITFTVELSKQTGHMLQEVTHILDEQHRRISELENK